MLVGCGVLVEHNVLEEVKRLVKALVLGRVLWKIMHSLITQGNTFFVAKVKKVI